MAKRYSGKVVLDIHPRNNYYEVKLYLDGRHVDTQNVTKFEGQPDSPESFDDVALSALYFSESSSSRVSKYADRGTRGVGYHIGRFPGDAWSHQENPLSDFPHEHPWMTFFLGLAVLSTISSLFMGAPAAKKPTPVIGPAPGTLPGTQQVNLPTGASVTLLVLVPPGMGQPDLDTQLQLLQLTPSGTTAQTFPSPSAAGTFYATQVTNQGAPTLLQTGMVLATINGLPMIISGIQGALA